MYKGNCRRHHSGHILASIFTRPVSVTEHNAIHHDDGKCVLKRKSFMTWMISNNDILENACQLTQEQFKEILRKKRQTAKYYSLQ